MTVNLSGTESIPGTEALKRVMLQGIYFTVAHEAWTTAVTGSGGATLGSAYNEFTTGTTTGSTSRGYTGSFLMAAASDIGINFSKRILLGFSVRRGTGDASIIARVQLKAATAEGALAARGFGIRMANLTMTGESYETADAFTGTIQAMSAANPYYVTIDHEPSVPRLRWYVNGVVQATSTTSANIPQSVTANVVLLASVLNGAGTANGALEIGGITLYQEH